MQDWFLRYELKSVPGVAEVASIGGMVKQYQVVLDPQKLVSYDVTQADVTEALKRANSETGGSIVEMAEAEYVMRATGQPPIPATARGSGRGERSGAPGRRGEL